MQSLLWEQQKQLQHMHLQMENLTVPVLRSGGGVACGLGVHRPLSRTQSSPASTSLTLPEKTLSLSPQDPNSKPRFTTGELKLIRFNKKDVSQLKEVLLQLRG